MINAIVTSLNVDNLLVSPTVAVELTALVGKKIRYWKGDKPYLGKIAGIEDPFLVVKFDEWPYGIGQGQMIEIFETPEDELPEA
jgi:hypothetical protein